MSLNLSKVFEERCGLETLDLGRCLIYVSKEMKNRYIPNESEAFWYGMTPFAHKVLLDISKFLVAMF